MTSTSYPFLTGGGEMGQLIRQYDWSKNPLGTPDAWPSALRTLVSTLLHAKFPMLLWWGPELIQFYNDAYRPSLGHSGKHPTALGQRGQDCWPETWPTVWPLIEGVLTGGEATWQQDQLIPIDRNGQREAVYWTFSYSPVHDETGQVAGVLVTCLETTRQVLAHQSVQRAQQEVLGLFEQSPAAIALIDQQALTFRMANPFYGQLVGRSPESLIGKSLLEALPELEGQGFEHLLAKVIDTGQPFVADEVAVRIIRQDQFQTIYVNLTYQPQRGADGRVTGVLVVATDVTQQVQTRQAVEASEARFRTLANHIDQLAWIARADGWIDWYNDRWYAYTGTTLSQMQGWGWQSVHHPDHVERVTTYVSQAWAQGRPFELTFPLRSREGVYRWFLTRAYPIKDKTGQVRQWVGTNTDIDAQKQHEARLEAQVEARTEQLQELVEDLRHSNDNLQQFAYVASHDLQEPLRKIQAFGDMLREQYGEQLAEGLPFLERMQVAARRMSALIHDLLAYSRLSTDKRPFVPVALGSVIEEILDDLEVSLAQTSAVLTIDPLPVVAGDPVQLRQLFQNLLSNALKFRRPDQPPRIELTWQEVAATSVSVETRAERLYALRVSDNGIGFDHQYAERIFGVFQRLHGRNSIYAGTGIGLAICKKVAQEHGGDITAQGQEGGGAVFTVYLPVSQPKPMP